MLSWTISKCDETRFNVVFDDSRLHKHWQVDVMEFDFRRVDGLRVRGRWLRAVGESTCKFCQFDCGTLVRKYIESDTTLLGHEESIPVVFWECVQDTIPLS